MKKIRLLTCIIVCMFFVLGLTACENKLPEAVKENSGQMVDEIKENSVSTTADSTEDNKAETITIKEDTSDVNTSVVETEDKVETGAEKGTLVVVFSATGTTKGVAEKIAAITDADFYEIIPKEEYTSDDLNYNDSDSRASREQNDSSARPEIGSDKIDLSGYERIYIGYPIWFGKEPRIMDTFVEAYDFGSITMIPFCTSGSSGIGQSGKNLEENAGSGKWLEGKRFSGNVSEEDLRSWIEGLQ